MKYGLIVLVVALALVLTVGIPSLDQDFHDGRWQFWYDTALWTFVLDRIPEGPNEYTGLSLHVPDIYCYKHIGGYTGNFMVSFLVVPGDTNFLVRWDSGSWFGNGGCVWDGSWSTGLLERNKDG